MFGNTDKDRTYETPKATETKATTTPQPTTTKPAAAAQPRLLSSIFAAGAVRWTRLRAGPSPFTP